MIVFTQNLIGELVMPGPYSTHIIVNVFRCVSQLVFQLPDLLNSPGVFRIAGSKEESEMLLERIIANDFNLEILTDYVIESGRVNNLHLNNILGMLTLVLKESVLLNPEDTLLTVFTKELKTLLNSDISKVENKKAATQLLDHFIDSLLLSKILDHQRVGEILYHYCYLMHTAGNFHESNRMTWENLAIILAPHFTDELGLYPAEDLLGLTQFTNQLRPMLEYFIAHPNTGIPFKERHANKLEHLADTRHTVIEKLTNMGEVARKQVTTPMKSLMLQASMLQAQVDVVENQLKNSSLKRNDKKELTRQLIELTEELKKINLEISELTGKIKIMNHDSSVLHEEIRMISRSEDAVRKPHTQQSVASSSKISSSIRIELGIFGNNQPTSSAYLAPATEEEITATSDYSSSVSTKLT